MHQSVKKAITAVFVLLTIIFTVLWCGRDMMVRHYIGSKLEQIEKQHHLSIHYKEMKMEGLTGIRIDNLCIVPNGSDTLFYAGYFRVQLSLHKLLSLKMEVKNIEGDDLFLHFIKNGSSSNFDFLYRTPSFSSKEVSAETHERNYTAKAKKTLNLLFKLLPANASLHDLCVSYSNKGDELRIEIPDLTVQQNRFVTEIRSTENDIQSEWICEGILQDNEKKIEACLYGKEDTKISLPFLEYRWGSQVQFDSLSFELQELKGKTDLQSIQGRTHVSGLTLHHERISPDTILLDRGTFSWLLHIGKNYAELDSSTEIRFNRLDFHPYLKLEKQDTAWHVTASINKRSFPANDLFSSLPCGLFYNLEGLEASGTLSYRFLLDVDFGRIDSLLFESSLTANNFRIEKFGNTDLRKMNTPFMYTAYEKGEPVHSFEVGERNSSFRPYSSISPYLPLAIMQSEDAGFFHHAGFIPSAIRESLVQDLKEKRFARGGSTLSMQLVKNVFLSRNKTIARKLEEILIVWLIENNRLTSKERMFEVYLNIVEWGPLIYGASEAAHYYFGKEVSALTLSECIFMASIIPKPKYVRYCFDGLQLKPYYHEFYNIIVNRMLDRGLITPGEAEGVSPEAVKITGAAIKDLIPPP